MTESEIEMPLPILAGVTRVSLNWEDAAANLQATNVMHFLNDAVDLPGLFASIDSHVAANMWALQSANVKVTSVSMIDLSTSTGPSEEFATTGAKWSGSGSADYSPQTCTIVKLRTALRGRRHRGRLYLPFTGETQQSHGTIQPVDATLVQTAWNTFRTAMATDLFPLLVASYTGLSAEQVTTCVVETLTGTQRRRQSQQR